MPLKLKDDKGVEHEVLSEEEVDKLVEEEKKKAVDEATKSIEDKYKKESDEKEKKLNDLNSELSTAKEALSKADQGTKDWAETRNTIKDLTGKIENLTKERDSDRKQFSDDLRNVRTSTFKSTIENWLDSASGGDAEVRKKLEFQYNRLGKDVTDEKQAMEIMKDAHLLVTGKQAPNMFNVARGFTGGQPPKTNEPTSQAVSELGSKFGISDDDIKKYGAKAAEKKANITQ